MPIPTHACPSKEGEVCLFACAWYVLRVEPRPAAQSLSWHHSVVMAKRRDLIPLALRIALRNAVGGWGPYTVREIHDLFNSHEFVDRAQVDDAGGERRTAAEELHAAIDWASPEQAQRYLDLVADVLDHYPEMDNTPGSPGRNLRRALRQGGFVGNDGRLRLPGVQPAAVEPDVEGIWTPDRLRVFLSHVHALRSEATELANVLESFHCSCFVAHVQIEPSQDWRDVIERALRTCHALAAYVTPDFHGSLWTDQEVGWALGRGVPVIPISAGVQPYGFFGAIQAIQAGQWGAWTIGFQVFRAIALRSFRDGPPRNANAAIVARAVVRAVCDSPSYDGTRQRFPLLDVIPAHLSRVFGKLGLASRVQLAAEAARRSD
jgi:TIR domain